MRSENATGGSKERTFIEAARRAQIIEAAIDTIAELGYGQASLSRIAERAGASKGVISYHFDGKDELVRELVADVVSRAAAYLRPLVLAETTGAGRLRSAIEANVAYMSGHRNEMIAVAEIARNARDAQGNRPFDSSFVQAGAGALARLLAQGQEAGEFRADFDPAVAASTIRAAIDAIPHRLARQPALDLDHYGRELANLFDVATRKKA